MIDLNQSYKPSPDVVVTELDGENESVLLHLGTKKYYTLNETGVHIWRLLDAGSEIDEIAQKICAEYEASFSSAKKSVSELIQELVKEELLIQG